ncbi:MAG: hemagluttinin repeat-containing protein, partial [Bacteroidetes bacterium]|nr:hemagluttinin repeat-containing protein [Bacteroidota bacterium]
IQRTGGTAWKLGICSFVFNFTPTLTFSSELVEGIWDNNTSSFYGDQFTSSYGGGTARSIETDFNGIAGEGTDIPTVATLIGTLRFTSTGAATITWNVPFSFITDDAGNDVTAGITFTNPGPLPITLSSFTATIVNQGRVRLDWTTISEINNYGFEVQKSSENQNSYQVIPNSFIPGNGTTNEPHSYSFTDNTASSGRWFYRLKQIDLDGTIHFTDGIQVDVLTSVTEKPLPKEFALDQNYPNPFNPTTRIEYAVPRESHVRLVIYNLLGQQVATLVDEVKSAGYYTVSFSATEFSSGLYFYKMNAGNISFLKKMMLVK